MLLFCNIDVLIDQLQKNDSGLETLDLVGPFRDASDDKFETLVDELQKNTSIRKIKVDYSCIYDPSYGNSLSVSRRKLSHFLEIIATKPLEEIHLYSTSIGSELQMQLIVPLISRRTLIKLEFDRCIRVMSLDDSIALQRALEGHPCLREVTFRNMRFIAHSSAEEFPRLDPLLLALSSIPNLGEFSLHCASTSYLYYHHRLHSAEALALLVLNGSKNLTKISLTNLRLNDEDMNNLADSLSRHQRPLSFLSLSKYRCDDNVSGDGFKRLLKILLQLESLRTLLVVDDEESSSLEQQPSLDPFVLPLLRRNHQIMELQLPCTTPSVNLYVRLNQAGRRMLQNPKTSAAEWIHILEQVSDDLDALFCILTESPGFILLLS